jgi:hypothetical protein
MVEPNKIEECLYDHLTSGEISGVFAFQESLKDASNPGLVYNDFGGFPLSVSNDQNRKWSITHCGH